MAKTEESSLSGRRSAHQISADADCAPPGRWSRETQSRAAGWTNGSDGGNREASSASTPLVPATSFSSRRTNVSETLGKRETR